MKHHAIEHTPVYDLDAHTQRQRKRHRRTIIRNIFETAIYSTTLVLSFQLFFVGGPVA